MTAPVDDARPPTDPDPITNPEPITTPGGRVVAPGGWRRAVTGLAVGVAAGVVHRLARALDEASSSTAAASSTRSDQEARTRVGGGRTRGGGS